MTSISTTEILAIRLLNRIQKMYGFNIQECYSKWAYTQLENGCISDNLNILAGISIDDNFFLVESYFLKALKDLHIEIPNDGDAVRKYAISICDKILNNEISEKEGCHILATIYADLNYAAQYQKWFDIDENIDEKSESDFKKAVREQAKQFLKT